MSVTRGKYMKQTCLALPLMICTPLVYAGEATATLTWSQRAELAMPVSGVISRVLVAPGAHVKRGTVLAELDATGLQAQADASAAALPRLRAERDEAQRDLKRMQELYDRTVLSTTDLDQAKLRFTRAQSALREGEAQARVHKFQWQQSRLLAPFDGLIVSVMASPGQVVAAALQPKPIIVLAQDTPMRAIAWLPAGEVAQLKAGQRVSVSAGQTTVSGSVASIGLEMDGGKNAYPVAVDVPGLTGTPAGIAVKLKW